MKALIRVLTLCVVGSALGVQAADGSRFYFKIDAGANLPQETKFKEFNGASLPATITVPPGGDLFGFAATPGTYTVSKPKLTFDPGARVDLAIGYNFNPSWSTEIEAGAIWNSVDKIKFQATGPAGSFSEEIKPDANFWQVPLLANLIYKLPLQSRLKPFVGIGAGGIFTRLEGKDINGNQDDIGFAYQGMAGITYALSDAVDIGLTYKFLGTLEQKYSGAKTENIYNHSILASLAFKF